MDSRNTDVKECLFEIDFDNFIFIGNKIDDRIYEIPKRDLKWFNKTDFKLVSSLPQLKLFSNYVPKKLFKSDDKNQNKTNPFDHLYANYQLLKTCSKEGGVFIIVGRKKLK